MSTAAPQKWRDPEPDDYRLPSTADEIARIRREYERRSQSREGAFVAALDMDLFDRLTRAAAPDGAATVERWHRTMATLRSSERRWAFRTRVTSSLVLLILMALLLVPIISVAAKTSITSSATLISFDIDEMISIITAVVGIIAWTMAVGDVFGRLGISPWANPFRRLRIELEKVTIDYLSSSGHSAINVGKRQLDVFSAKLEVLSCLAGHEKPLASLLDTAFDSRLKRVRLVGVSEGGEERLARRVRQVIGLSEQHTTELIGAAPVELPVAVGGEAVARYVIQQLQDPESRVALDLIDSPETPSNLRQLVIRNYDVNRRKEVIAVTRSVTGVAERDLELLFGSKCVTLPVFVAGGKLGDFLRDVFEAAGADAEFVNCPG